MASTPISQPEKPGTSQDARGSTADAATHTAWLTHMRTGQQHFQRGEMHEAVLCFKQATETEPTQLAGWINLGSALLEYQQFDAAIRNIENAIALDPGQMVSHMLLGDALRMQGKSTAALDSYQRAVDLSREPAALNKLACALRSKRRFKEASTLYEEAISKGPRYNLPRVNLATLKLETDAIEEAGQLLDSLAEAELKDAERREVEFARRSLALRTHLGDAIAGLTADTGLAAMETALQTVPDTSTERDAPIWAGLMHYGESARAICAPPAASTKPLPEDWPAIEALFTIPIANSAADYVRLRDDFHLVESEQGELGTAALVRQAIVAARQTHGELNDGYSTEARLRYWHALACDPEQGVMPGHFKYTQFWLPNEPTRRRCEPALSSNTLRAFVDEILLPAEPGYPRAALILMAMADIHPFADANTRVSLTWMNRELEAAGMLPALFPLEGGNREKLKDTMRRVYSGNGDIAPLIEVIRQGQAFSLDFLTELEKIEF